ncbi:Uncharacterized conserved protein [Pseudomonas pohangensis]|uniref:Uncharacterized conserved protein n=1 Tax=Pseudomonas pohangensis TaxID=364197 RepID=A0A1H2G1B1_9PSED|nr:CRISPR system precrRNA processing endoribonuclease RAMP protein Cas6 [Pseudomonas pohangensis]SDU13357.1 Uncharacterized conserved protein [Pseudomonas pohangensis]
MTLAALAPMQQPPIERWLLQVTPQTPIPQCEQAGSMLRGAFGHALKALACKCPAEQHAADCIYQQIFEPLAPADWPVRYQDCPPAFVLTPPAAKNAAQSPLSIAFTLLGPSLQHAELIWSAWQLAAHLGLGNERISASIERQQILSQPPEAPAHGPLTLNFCSPLLIKRKLPGAMTSSPLQADQLGAADLFIALHRRLQLTHHLYGVHLTPPPALQHWLEIAEACEVVTRLKPVHFARRSNRQQQRMPLFGLCGTLQLRGPLDADLRASLALAQWLHIGGKTALGLGAFTLHGTDDLTFVPGNHRA